MADAPYYRSGKLKSKDGRESDEVSPVVIGNTAGRGLEEPRPLEAVVRPIKEIAYESAVLAGTRIRTGHWPVKPVPGSEEKVSKEDE